MELAFGHAGKILVRPLRAAEGGRNMKRQITALAGVRGKFVMLAGDLLLLTVLVRSVLLWNGQENVRSLLAVLGACALLLLFNRYCSRVLRGARLPAIPYF